MRFVGHAEIWERLDRAIREDRLAHALVFTGPSGIGKALLARELAARIVCTATDAPCGECDRCRRVEAQSHADVRFVAVPAGKKDIGVDTARDLKSFIQMSAIDGPCKVVVIDQADRLTIAAQNAMLKTLEEPPGRAVIILVTDTAGALLTTVRSRCQRISFAPLNDDQLRQALGAQGLTGDDVESLAVIAGGSPGRALQARELIESGTLDELESSLAALASGGYVAAVEFAKQLGQSEQEMASRLPILEELLQRRMIDQIRSGKTDKNGLHGALQRLSVLAKAGELLRRRNPNRSLLAEATALRLAGIEEWNA